jgi:hypothetical protein
MKLAEFAKIDDFLLLVLPLVLLDDILILLIFAVMSCSDEGREGERMNY